ncbi:hypothetical protein ACFLT7_08835, partial [candidate division KSB1 bacterium]
NESEARKVSLLCSSLFVVGILFWAIPPMAARVLYPDLSATLNLPNPDEGSFVVIALHLLPHGLIGLLVSAMFAATMSSLASIFNLLSGIVAKDIFQRLINRSMGDKGLLVVGRIATLIIGILVVGFSLLIVRHGVGAFQIMMKISSLTITPLATPMLLGFLFRRPPGWAGLFSFCCSVAAAIVFAFHTPLVDSLKAAGPWVDYSVSVLVIVSVGVASFFGSSLIFRSSEAESKRIDGFFTRLRTPVDVSSEVKATDIDRAQVSGFIGTIALIIGGLVVLFVFIPAGMGDRLINLAVGIVFLAIGWGLLRSGRKEQTRAGSGAVS